MHQIPFLRLGSRAASVAVCVKRLTHDVAPPVYKLLSWSLNHCPGGIITLTLISFLMLKNFSKLFSLVILLLHHAYAVPVHPRNDRPVVHRPGSQEHDAAEILLGMSREEIAAGALVRISGGHASQQRQPNIGHSEQHKLEAASPVQHASQSSQPQRRQRKSFVGSDTLTRHIKQEHGEKSTQQRQPNIKLEAASPVQHASQSSQSQRHQCTGCRKSYVRLDTLTRHIKQEHGEKSKSCPKFFT